MANAYEQEKAKYLQHLEVDSGAASTGGSRHAFETTPLFSLGVKYAGIEKESASRSDVNDIQNGLGSIAINQSTGQQNDDGRTNHSPAQASNDDVLSQYSLLGFHIGDHPTIGLDEPVMLNTRAPNSTFLCGSQGSGKSFTLGCMLENCLLPDSRYGAVANPVAGVAFHYDNDAPGAAEVASLCSRGIEVNVLVSSSNFHQLEKAYHKMAKEVGGKVKVNRLLFKDSDISIERMHKLMNITENADSGVPLYVSIIHDTLQKTATRGETITIEQLERDLAAVQFAPGQKVMLEMRMRLLKSFLQSYAEKNHRPTRDLLAIKPGSLTIVDLSDPLIEPSMVCTLFDICLGIFKANRPKDGLVVTLDEAHKYLNESIGAAKFTDHLVSTIRMQRHHATRVIVATQEPTISGSLLDLCSTSIVHRFTSPAWFQAIKDHLSAASSLVADASEQKTMFEGIVNLGTGESFVFSPSSYVCLEEGKEKMLGTGVMKMKTWREGKDLGRSKMAGQEE
jgi:hypothetical protein